MVRVCFNLTFDGTVERGVCCLWQSIADAGIELHKLPSYRPHISLACYDVPAIAPYETDIAIVATTTPSFSIRLDSLGIFPEAGVVFLAPRMSQALFGLHRAVFGAFDAPGKPSVIDEYLLPDLWMPHCTLAVRLTPEELLTVVDTCERVWAPIRGQATGIGMRLPPAPVDYYHYSLQQSSVE